MKNNLMGLVGLSVAVLLMVAGAGYWFFGASHSPLSVSDTSSLTTITEEISQGQSVIDTARDVKDLVEQKAEETMKAADEPKAGMAAPKETTKNAEQKTSAPDIMNRLMRSGFTATKGERKIDTIVLHSSYDLAGSDPYSVEGVIKEYEDYGVSAHYLIDRKGTIYRLVEDKNIAYHAGVSKMPDGRTDTNDFSIGIEMLNTKEDRYTDAEYKAVNDLIAYLKGKYPVKNVVGHDDIAPGRKTDPWNFDWKRVK